MNDIVGTAVLLAQKNPLPLWFLSAFLIFFPTLWLGIFFAASRIFGWRDLAEFYGTDEQPEGVRTTWQSAQLRWMGNYNNCLTFIATERGFWVRPMWPFRAWHRGLFFPWSDVTAESERTWIFRIVRFNFAEVPNLPMKIPARLAEKLKAVAGDAWPQGTGNGD